MKSYIHLILIFILPTFLTAGVERFLQPFQLDGKYRSSYEQKVDFYRSDNNLKLQTHDVFKKNPSLLTSLRLEELLSDSLKHRYQANGEVRVKLASSWKPLESSSTALIKIRDVSPDELSSSCFVRFSLWNSGEKLGDFSLPLRVAHMHEVYFSNKTLNRGTKLTKYDFGLRIVDVLKQHANSVLKSTNLKGFELQSNLSANSPLKWNVLSKATLIKKGQVVDVYASGNGIFVTMKGLALEDGVADSFVKVRNLSSEKEFHAKVLTERSVKVHL